MTLSDMLKQFMRTHELTYEEFARRCGLTKGYISMLVNNRNPKTGKPPVPKIETYDSIAKGLGISLDDLFRMMDDAPVRIGDSVEDEGARRGVTREARILSAGVDRMPEAARKKAVQLMEMVFAEYADYFKDEGDESDES